MSHANGREPSGLSNHPWGMSREPLDMSDEPWPGYVVRAKGREPGANSHGT